MAAGGLRWYVQVIIVWTVKTKPCSLFIPFWQDFIVLHPSSRERSIIHAWCFSRLTMSVPTPEYVFDSTAVGKAPWVCMEASGWKHYIFLTGDCMSCTHTT